MAYELMPHCVMHVFMQVGCSLQASAASCHEMSRRGGVVKQGIRCEVLGGHAAGGRA